jgi:4-hydroxybenzoate polyprenyltransferase
MKKEQTANQKSRFDLLLLALSAAVMIIGVHQTYMNGFSNAYWLFMLSIAIFLYHQIRKLKRKQEANQPKLNRRAKRFMNKNG